MCSGVSNRVCLKFTAWFIAQQSIRTSLLWMSEKDGSFQISNFKWFDFPFWGLSGRINYVCLCRWQEKKSCPNSTSERQRMTQPSDWSHGSWKKIIKKNDSWWSCSTYGSDDVILCQWKKQKHEIDERENWMRRFSFLIEIDVRTCATEAKRNDSNVLFRYAKNRKREEWDKRSVWPPKLYDRFNEFFFITFLSECHLVWRKS